MRNNKIFLLLPLSFLFQVFGCSHENPEVRWQIKNEYPAYGLSLGYEIPGNQLQQIIGDAFKPKLDKNGNGYLMLFIATAEKYYLDTELQDHMHIAHILVDTENSLNCPLSIGAETQALNTILGEFKFKLEPGEVNLEVTQEASTYDLEASIKTPDGSIMMRSTFAKTPTDRVDVDNTKVSATGNPHYLFKGSESFNTIPIDTIAIKSEGRNWLTELELPAKPNQIWLSTDFVWDFTFTQEADPIHK